MCPWRSVQYLTRSNGISMIINLHLYFNVQLLDNRLHFPNYTSYKCPSKRMRSNDQFCYYEFFDAYTENNLL